MEEGKVISSKTQTQKINIQLLSLTLKNKCLLYFICSNSKYFIYYISLPRYSRGRVGAGGVDEKVGIPPTTNLDEKWMKGDSKRETALILSPMLMEKE